MIVRLSLPELQAAVAEWLQRRGATVSPNNVHLRMLSSVGERLSVAGVTAVVEVDGVEIPPTEGPYR